MKYMLISVCERDIYTETFSTFEDAHNQMMKEFKEQFDKCFDDETWNEITSENEFYESQNFEFGPMKAWSNIDFDYLCDWKIVEIK